MHDPHPEQAAHGFDAPGPERIRAGLVFGWGLGMFVVVILSIVALDAYFWWEAEREQTVKVAERSTFGDTLKVLRARETEALTTYGKGPGDRYRIPIERAMELVVKEGL